MPEGQSRIADIPRGTAPFTSVEDAWFWTVGALRARREGGSRQTAGTARPCVPDDILNCLDRLYRNRRIDLSHARILRIWGEQQMAPAGRRPNARDALLWREAMERLGPVLREKGIVV